MRYILALDQGTTSSRAIAFDTQGRVAALAQREFAQHFPQPGWVEHDAAEIWDNTRKVCAEALAKKDLDSDDIAAVITYTRNTWSNKAAENIVQPAEVLAARSKQ